jgi:hypothetical protein
VAAIKEAREILAASHSFLSCNLSPRFQFCPSLRFCRFVKPTTYVFSIPDFGSIPTRASKISPVFAFS